MYSTMHDRRGGMWRLVWWTFWVLVIVYVFRNPSEAADNARALVEWLGRASESIATFVQQTAGNGND